MDNLQKILRGNNLDAILVSSSTNISYLTGYSGFSLLEREAYMIITKKSQHLITDGRYINAVKSLDKDLNIHEITSTSPLTNLLEEIIASEKIKVLGFELENLTVAEYVKIKKIKGKLKSVSLTNLRVIKTKDEIEKIKASCDIAGSAFTHTKKTIKAGMTENEVAWIFEKFVKEHAADLSFPTIVAFGKNAATPHHATSSRVLKPNDPILMDFGVRYNNYCSDTTRTFFFGKETKEFRKMYEAVENSQQLATEFIKTSLKNDKLIKASDVDKVARNYILSQAYPTIPHSLGHGIGLEVHETPRLSPSSKDALKEGMVFSLEPGIYIPEFGGVRIEDLFTIKNNNLIKLT